MAYQEHKIHIEEAEDYMVAEMLAYIAGFPQKTAIMSRSPGDKMESRRTITVFHPETIALDPDMFAAVCSPDILVSQILGQEFVIEHNERVNPSLLEQLASRVKEHMAASSAK